MLPFVNMSSDKGAGIFFRWPVWEGFLNQVAQIPQLRVIARTSSFSLTGAEVDRNPSPKRVNVANVLEVSVRKSANTLRHHCAVDPLFRQFASLVEICDRDRTDIFQGPRRDRLAMLWPRSR